MVKKQIFINSIRLGDIVFASSDDGLIACPVCGFLLSTDRPPVESDGSALSFSFDICPCCNTQFGLDDDEFLIEEGGLTKVWKGLRSEWISKTGISKDKIQNQLNNIE